MVLDDGSIGLPGDDTDGARELPGEVSVQARIREIVSQEQFAVLCTQGDAQPYGSLVAFAFSEDLGSVVFSTAVTTRKYDLLTKCRQVALVIDTRAQCPGELMQIEALTATGRATHVLPGPERDRMAAMLTQRHPYLKSFVAAETCALIRVDIVRFFHVCRFQKVRQWTPTSRG